MRNIYNRMLYPLLILLLVSCSTVKKYRTDVCELLLPEGTSLEISTDLDQSGFIVYNVIVDRYSDHTLIILYPMSFDPKSVLESRHENNHIMRFCHTQFFDYGKNMGVMKHFKNDLIEMQSYCFNQKGWTIIIESFDDIYSYQSLEQLVYSFNILKSIE